MTLNITKQKIRKLAMMFNQTQKRRPNAKRRRHGKTFNKYKKESMLGRKTMRGGSGNGLFSGINALAQSGMFSSVSKNSDFVTKEKVKIDDNYTRDQYINYIERIITQYRFKFSEKNKINSIIKELNKIKLELENLKLEKDEAEKVVTINQQQQQEQDQEDDVAKVEAEGLKTEQEATEKLKTEENDNEPQQQPKDFDDRLNEKTGQLNMSEFADQDTESKYEEKKQLETSIAAGLIKTELVNQQQQQQQEDDAAKVKANRLNTEQAATEKLKTKEVTVNEQQQQESDSNTVVGREPSFQNKEAVNYNESSNDSVQTDKNSVSYNVNNGSGGEQNEDGSVIYTSGGGNNVSESEDKNVIISNDQKISLLKKYISELQDIIKDIDNYENANTVIKFLRNYKEDDYKDLINDKDLNSELNIFGISKVLNDYNVFGKTFISNMNKIQFKKASFLITNSNIFTQNIPLKKQKFKNFIHAYEKLKDKLNINEDTDTDKDDFYLYRFIERSLNKKSGGINDGIIVTVNNDEQNNPKEEPVITVIKFPEDKKDLVQSPTTEDNLQIRLKQDNQPSVITNDETKTLLEQVKQNTKTLHEACEALKDCMKGFTDKVSDTNKNFEILLRTFKSSTEEHKEN